MSSCWNTRSMIEVLIAYEHHSVRSHQRPWPRRRSWPALRNRIALSRAKHRSLSGHARLSQRLAKLMPFYEYGEDHFFRSDRAPADVAARRRIGFERLAHWLSRRVASDRPGNRRTRIGLVGSPVRQRLPRSFSIRRVRTKASEGRRARAGVIGRPGHGISTAVCIRSHRLLRRQCVRLRLLQGMHRRRHRTRPRSGTGAWLVSPGGRRERPETAGDFRARRSLVPHVRHRSGDAGGPARAVPHRAARTSCASAARTTDGGTMCSRASVRLASCAARTR